MTGSRAIRSRPALSVRHGGTADTHRALAEEVPVALVYNGATQAVMMASPQDLEDFALGFSLTEGIVAAPDEIESLEIVAHGTGLEARMWIAPARAGELAARRRAMTGPVGCGLCGIDSLEEALRPVATVADVPLVLPASDIDAAMAALRAGQILHDRTHAAHAAGFWRPGAGLVLLREDVGRHNALDKLAGALLRAGIAPRSGAVPSSSPHFAPLPRQEELAASEPAAARPTLTALVAGAVLALAALRVVLRLTAGLLRLLWAGVEEIRSPR